ncbi:MAG: ROK family protein [Raoultibacter sp.]
MREYLLGIDVGGTNTKVGLFSAEGQLCDKRSFPTRTTGDPLCFSDLMGACDAILASCCLARIDVSAIGIALPGIIDAHGSLLLCPNIDLDLRSYQDHLADFFPGICVVVLNDANAAALGERWQGSAVGVDDFLLVTLGTGIGGGLVQGGVLCVGSHGAAGELGHVCVCPTETEMCSCGRYGCLEQYASGTGLVHNAHRQMTREEGAQATSSLSCLATVTAKDVFDHARAGDRVALAAVSDFVRFLGFGLAQIACVVDPRLIVVGGGLSASAPWYLDDLVCAYRRYALPICQDTSLAAAQLGGECGIFGAAAFAREALRSSMGDFWTQ